MNIEIYLDNAATTRPYQAVIDTVSSFMGDQFGNASSLHRRGVDAQAAIEASKRSIASLVGGSRWNVIFTSGGTEANNLVIHSFGKTGKRIDIVTSSVEHASVMDCASQIASQNGGTHKIISAGTTGVISPNELKQLVDKQTALVSIIHVANETGTVQPVDQAAKMVKQLNPRTKVHVDAVQAAAQLEKLYYCNEIDAVTISGHKIHGPQGVGAILVRPPMAIKPLFTGGDQQHKMRPGTFNLPGITGMGKAARIVTEKKPIAIPDMQSVRDAFLNKALGPGIRLLFDASQLAPGMAVLAVADVKSEILLHTLEKKGVIVSSGSACHSSRTEPPQSYSDAGLQPTEGVLRISFCYENTITDAENAAAILRDAAQQVSEGRVGV